MSRVTIPEAFQGVGRERWNSPNRARARNWSVPMKSFARGFFARACRGIAIGGIGVLLVLLLLYAYGARINRTNSLPKGIYWVVDKPP
jgi:hypothetical protein